MSFLTTLQKFRSTQGMRFIYSALVVVTVLGVAFALMMSQSTAEESDQTIITVVNGQTISKEKFLDKLVAWHGETALVKLINEILLVERAKAEGIDIDEVRLFVDQYIMDVRLSDPTLTGDLSWKAFLNDYGYTDDSLRQDLLVEQLLTVLLGDKIIVTDEEVDAMWELYAEEFADIGPDVVKPYLRQELANQKFLEAVEDLFEELYAEANIEYFLKENGIKLDPATFLVPGLRQAAAGQSQADSDDDLIILD